MDCRQEEGGQSGCFLLEDWQQTGEELGLQPADHLHQGGGGQHWHQKWGDTGAKKDLVIM